MCARLGDWQLSRWHDKRALNEARRAALAAPPLDHGPRVRPAAQVAGRTVRLEGRFDGRRHVLLPGRLHEGEPGVEVVTPLVLPGDTVAVLVLRGWLYAADAVHARPQDHPEPPGRAVIGLATAIPRGAGGFAWRSIEDDTARLWTTNALDADSAAARLPYAVAPYVVRELPGPGVPEAPRRTPPGPLNEAMHLGYAIQWFAVGAITLVGSIALAWSRRRGAR